MLEGKEPLVILFHGQCGFGPSVDVELLGRGSVFVPGRLWVSCSRGEPRSGVGKGEVGS